MAFASSRGSISNRRGQDDDDDDADSSAPVDPSKSMLFVDTCVRRSFVMHGVIQIIASAWLLGQVINEIHASRLFSQCTEHGSRK